jgi:Mannosyl-glycoprotein endo-beta-N-acetylglucosaminidase
VEAAQTAVGTDQTAVGNDQANLAQDQTTSAMDAAAAEQATQKLGGDRAALALAIKADTAAQARLQIDRARLRTILVAIYAGSGIGPPLTGGVALSIIQDELYGQTEATIVVHTVVKGVGVDVRNASATHQRHLQLAAAVATDTSTLASDTTSAAAARQQVAADQTSLSAAQLGLTADQERLGRAVATQRAAVRAVVGPPAPGGGLSVMGLSALTGAQMAGWFTVAGFADLTSVPIAQLADWYVQQGSRLGVRGDVAFAQAVLETGGFASSDAVTLSNYAGIGHCDTCSQGWAFPSPAGGVLGQLQLLRIFATSSGVSAAGLPPPVLPALTTAHESRAGCCQTWEALSGVWASDPSYGAQILSLYQQMLAFALSPSSRAGAGTAA